MSLIYLIRTAFASLLSFEFLNSINVLKFPLHFPWIILVLLSSLFWFLWERCFKRKAKHFPLVSSLFLFQLYANTLGNVFKFYTKFVWFDRFLHFTGGAAAGTTLFLGLNYVNKKRNWQLNTNLIILFALSLAISVCAVYEFLEYFIDSMFGYNMITDKYDTSRDLLLGFVGAVIGIFLISSILKPSADRNT